MNELCAMEMRKKPHNEGKNVLVWEGDEVEASHPSLSPSQYRGSFLPLPYGLPFQTPPPLTFPSPSLLFYPSLSIHTPSTYPTASTYPSRYTSQSTFLYQSHRAPSPYFLIYISPSTHPCHYPPLTISFPLISTLPFSLPNMSFQLPLPSCTHAISLPQSLPR